MEDGHTGACGHCVLKAVEVELRLDKGCVLILHQHMVAKIAEG